MTAPTATPPTAPTRSRTMSAIAVRWMPTFLGFPAGGFVAEIVGRVDSPAPAIAGGAITGAILGFVQWIGMRRTGPSPLAWIIATACGFAVGLGIGAATVRYRTDLGSLVTQGVICGAVVGVAQAAVLHRVLGRIAVLWPAATAGSWGLGWATTSTAGIDVDAQYTVFGSSGALLVAALSCALPIQLAHRRQGTANARNRLVATVPPADVRRRHRPGSINASRRSDRVAGVVASGDRT
jgi:hypothetical protein